MPVEPFFKLQKCVGGILYCFIVIKAGCPVGVKGATVALLKCFSKKVPVGISVKTRTACQYFQIWQYGIFKINTA